MVQTRSFAGFADIDTSQRDVFETPDLVKDTGSISPVSSTHPDENINVEQLSLDSARERFLTAEADNNNTDFSKYFKGYQFSGVVPQESREQKILRLKLEIEDIIKDEEHFAQTQKSDNSQVDQLSSLLQTLERHSRSPITRLTNLTNENPLPKEDREQNGPINTHSRKYDLGILPSNYVDQIEYLDTRLAKLESALGISSSANAPILPSLTSIEHKVDLISSNPKELESILGLLDSSRKLINAPDESMALKVNSIFAALPAFDSISGIVHTLLLRLKSLHTLHADAGNIAITISSLDERSRRIQSDLVEWKTLLGEVETNLGKDKVTLIENIQAVEAQIKHLEGKISS